MKRILIASVLLLTATNLAPCQDSLNVIKLGSLFNYNNAAENMDRLGNVLYICQFDSGVSLVDISDPFRPQRVGVIRTFTPAFDVLTFDSLVLISTRDSGISIVDSDEMNIYQEIGNLRLGESLHGLFKQDSILYVAASHSGIKVINVADPRDPQMIGSLNLRGGAWNISIHNNLAFVTAFTYLYILDVSNPEDPSEISRTEMSFGVPGVCVRDDILYAADSDDGLKVFDIQDPFNPQLIGHFRTRGAAINVELSGSLAYVAAGEDGGLQVLDVGDIENISEVGYYDTPGCAEELIVGDSGLVYLGDYSNLGIYRYIPENGIANHDPIAYPASLGLSAHPNPFNCSTTIRYQIPTSASVSVRVFDLSGREVGSVFSGQSSPGEYQLLWNASGLQAGTYLMQLDAGKFRQGAKVTLMK